MCGRRGGSLPSGLDRVMTPCDGSEDRSVKSMRPVTMALMPAGPTPLGDPMGFHVLRDARPGHERSALWVRALKTVVPCPMDRPDPRTYRAFCAQLGDASV